MDKSRTSGEWERMVSGQLYTPVDPEIAKRGTGLVCAAVTGSTASRCGVQRPNSVRWSA